MTWAGHGDVVGDGDVVQEDSSLIVCVAAAGGTQR